MSQLLVGDCVEKMKTLEADSVDAIVTDPPYGLEFMGKAWDGFGTPLGFQTWTEQWAREAFRVLKPGGHLLAFGGTRMYHRLAVGVEDAGFEIRDTLMWLYGSGFPKSHNLKDEWQGWGTALKPAVEPIVLARKPLIGTVAENVLTHGTGALNIDASRIGTTVESWPSSRRYAVSSMGLPGHFPSVTQKTGDIPSGRWPANILLDEEAAALLDKQSGASTSKQAEQTYQPTIKSVFGIGASGGRGVNNAANTLADSGGASRFFYVAKANRAERNKGLKNNIHPTVKPVALMKYLIRLVTPEGGTVLDPFMGSGTTAVAAIEEGVNWIGCEREPEYVAIIEARIAAAQPGMGLNLEEDTQ